VHCRRPGLRQFELTADEQVYLRENWKTISTATEALGRRSSPSARVSSAPRRRHAQSAIVVPRRPSRN
jgi:hypothetical protein